MASFLPRRDDHPLIRIIPGALIMIATLISLTPLPFTGGQTLVPSFVLIAIYFWSLLRGELVPYWLLFLCGLISDALLAMPGVQALLFMLLKTVTGYVSNRFDRGSVWVFWTGFIVLSLLYWLAYWLLLHFLMQAPLPIANALTAWLAASICYPLLHWVFVRILDAMPPSRS